MRNCTIRVAKTGADQLRGNREADLRFCFRLCRFLVFPMRWLIITVVSTCNIVAEYVVAEYVKYPCGVRCCRYNSFKERVILIFFKKEAILS